MIVPLLSASASASSNSKAEKVDLRRGAVFSMSNAQDGNVVVAFSRNADGTLEPAGEYATGGTGSGGFEDSANGLVLGDQQGEVSPNNLSENKPKLLFATNAGSDTVSVFRVKKDRLDLVEVQPSGGEKPVSVTVNDQTVYVLNSNEELDGLVPPNCSIVNDPLAEPPTISGFTVDNSGALTPIAGATYALSGDANSGCAQVSFTPDGATIVVTERTAKTDGQAVDDEGVITTFQVGDDGRLSNRVVTDATGQGPFGFTFTKDGTLLTTEQFDGPAGPSLGAATSYGVNADGTLAPRSGSVRNGGTDTCWIVAHDNGDLAFTASFFDNFNPLAGTPEDDQPGARISAYRIADDGSLTLLKAIAFDAEQGASDISFSSDSEYLYQLNSFNGTINAFEVGPDDGSLELIQTVQAHAPSPIMAARLGIAAS
jgi:6-phosphogluconolactonase (cycloisomerase 2 family)